MAIPDPDGLLATILAMNEARRADYKAGFDDGYERGFLDGKMAGLVRKLQDREIVAESKKEKKNVQTS